MQYILRIGPVSTRRKKCVMKTCENLARDREPRSAERGRDYRYEEREKYTTIKKIRNSITNKYCDIDKNSL